MSLFSMFSDKLRCPSCGLVASHSKIIKSDNDKEIDEMMMSILPKGSIMEKGHKDEVKNGMFRCNKCAEEFTKYLSDLWANSAKRLGERVALDEYKKH